MFLLCAPLTKAYDLELRLTSEVVMIMFIPVESQALFSTSICNKTDAVELALKLAVRIPYSLIATTYIASPLLLTACFIYSTLYLLLTR